MTSVEKYALAFVKFQIELSNQFTADWISKIKINDYRNTKMPTKASSWATVQYFDGKLLTANIQYMSATTIAIFSRCVLFQAKKIAI